MEFWSVNLLSYLCLLLEQIEVILSFNELVNLNKQYRRRFSRKDKKKTTPNIKVNNTFTLAVMTTPLKMFIDKPL